MQARHRSEGQIVCMQIIDDFAAYNGEGFMSTLELLPMWQNVNPDVDLFGSGVVSELSDDASEWAAGHPLQLNGPCALLCHRVLRNHVRCTLPALRSSL